MRRREFISLLGGTAAWPLGAYAQDGRTYHVAVLNTNPRGSPVVTALFDELRRNGLVESRNLVVEGGGIGIPYPRFADAARELVKTNIEVFVVGGGAPPIRSVQAVAPAIPIASPGAASGEIVAAGTCHRLLALASHGTSPRRRSAEDRAQLWPAVFGLSGRGRPILRDGRTRSCSCLMDLWRRPPQNEAAGRWLTSHVIRPSIAHIAASMVQWVRHRPTSSR
jgi:hypothetical protein